MAPSVKLSIEKDPNKEGHYRVIVEGFGLHEAEARQAVIRIRGSDKWYDDNLFTMNVVEVNGSGFSWEESVPGNLLNEDWGEDDVYALVKIGDLEIKSNTVEGDFG